MRLSLIAVACFSACACARSSTLDERNAAPAPEAYPNAYAASAAAPLHPAVEALIERSLAERQSLTDIGTDISTLINDIGPTLQALGTLLNVNTLNEIISLISHANTLLDDTSTPAAYNLIIQANRLLSANNTDTLITLFGEIGPIITELSPLFTSLNSVLSGLSKFFGL